MNYQIGQIAERLRGLRDALDLSANDIAQKCSVSIDEYLKYESGYEDIPISFLFLVAQTFGIDTSELITGETPRSSSFFVTRKGKGVNIERQKSYNYQSLCSGFIGNNAEIFEVTVEPNENPLMLNRHKGQEFNFVLRGTLHLHIAGNDLVLYEGDSIYFDASKQHGMKAMNNEKVIFLAIII